MKGVPRGILILGLQICAGAGSWAAAPGPQPALCEPGSVAAATSAVAIPPATDLGDLSPEARMQVGLSAYRKGQLTTASAQWLAAAEAFHGDRADAREADALARAAQAREAQGFTREARLLLERARSPAEKSGDPQVQAAVLGALARSYTIAGEDALAESTLDDAIARAQGADATALWAALSKTRGDLRMAEGHPGEAAGDYGRAERASGSAGDAVLAAQASASAARAQIAAGEPAAARATLARATERAGALPDSDARAQVLVHAARSFEELAEAEPETLNTSMRRAAELYGQALTVAERSGASRTASFAAGRLGHVHERLGRPQDARTLTLRAIAAAQAAQAPEALYRWQWQLGRIAHSQGQEQAAIDSYRRAISTLEGLRGSSAGAGLSFGEDVEPVYFGLVDLLLLEAAKSDETPRRTALLTEARDQLEELKSAELTDYFQDACLVPAERKSASAIAGTVVVYPVVLADRTELIVSDPKKIQSVVIAIGASDLDARVDVFRDLLQNRTTRRYRRHAADFYDLLIRPLEAVIAGQEVETLVFVPGGSLRTIPMAALYDREAKQFLIEKYPIAVIPALSLVDPRPIDRSNVRTLRAGLTLPVQGFSALESVDSELEAVERVFGGEALVDDAFVVEALEASLGEAEYGIVHIATHGQFRSDASDSFLLTYDGKIELEHLGVLVERTRFRDQPIELLTLSACETAVGDDRGALGLAGVAVRAGARSALATLWTVNDQAAADLIGEFYQQLAKPDVSRAEALRRAQMSLLDARPYGHPGYWAPFLLISNWM